MSKVEQARRAAGMTQGAAAAILGISVPTYIKKEQNPSFMTFDDISMLGAEMDSLSRDILWQAVDDVRGADFDARPIGEITLGEFYGSGGCERLKMEFAATEENFFAKRV
jgi:transcriptional regulator with XRE-family HTH domain